MRIKKLELIGFKSFKDRTVIHFDAGITGIVGPNGCGKSNIVDALVWVMGEMSAKHLRGSNMSDVIFAGAEGYAPMGMAEVSLTLENDGGPFPVKYLKHSEIMVTRRLHRSGDSEYLINKEPARLRDVHEIFMDTGAGSKGFSIIEQGAIGKIITAKPEDRRTLIEEAAGITKFKVRKRESQRKLVSTEQNIVRLQDIIGEQKRQLDSLERQAQRAERYRNLKRELQDKEIVVSSKAFLALDKEAQELAREVETGRESEANWGAQVSELEASVQAARLESLEQEKKVEALQIDHGQAQLQTQNLEFTIRELNFEIEQARRSRDMTGSLLEQSQARRIAIDEDLKRVTEQMTDSTAKAEESTRLFSEKSAEFSTIQARVQAIDVDLTAKRREMLTVSQSETHLDARFQALNEKVSEQQERVGQASAVAEELRLKKAEFETRRNQTFHSLEQERQMQLDIMKDVENFVANRDILAKNVAEKQSEVAQFKDNLNQVASRLYGLENLQNNFEGFEEGVKQVMMWQRSRPEMHADGSVSLQPMAEIVEVPAEFELAMESALGNRLQLLVGDSGDAVLSAVDHLKSSQGGRSSFMAREWAAGENYADSETLKNEAGVVKFLSDVVSIPEARRGQVNPFFKDIVVVDSIRAALRLRAQYPGRTFVTMDGDCLSSDGVLTGGGSQSADSGLLKRRREIKELSQQREEWAGKTSLAQLSLQKLEAQLQKVSEEMESAKRRHIEKEMLVTALKKDLERAENELQNAEIAVNRQIQEMSREEANLVRLQGELEEVQERLEEMRGKRVELETTVATLDAEYMSSRQGIEGLQKLVTDLQIESASRTKEAEGLRQRFELLQKNLNEVETQVQQMSQESNKSTETLSSHQILIEQKKLELEQAIERSQELAGDLALERNTFEQIQSNLREIESKVNNINHSHFQMQSRLNEATLRLEQVRMKEQYLVDQIHERYMLDLRAVSPQYADVEIDLATQEAEVNELKAKLNKIGEVNLSSIEEYEDLAKRYQFLDQQCKDLVEAKEQLKKVIDRINRICSKRFKETFEQVNERFMKVFPVLFGGGEAKLILVEDPENGEMGIDIVSRPPGKKLQNVSLLSGGEKALTAVSLIFSIFLVKPSPYCLLDEVDAPLDDANVFRFNDLVKEMAKRSQIIIVTHNKHTMKVNNKLYGVTMEEKGVSKMVSVALEKAEQIATA